MIDDERLKALKMVTEARASVEDALLTAKDPQRKPLNDVLQCLKEIEEDLDVTLLDEHLTELEECRDLLLERNGRVDKNDADLKEPVRKVNAAAREITLAIEAARTVVKVPEKLEP